MTIQLHTIPSNEAIQTHRDSSAEALNHRGYRITRACGEFTDWDGGNASSDDSEVQRDNGVSDIATMEMGNRTEIHYKEPWISPPSGSYVINGMSFYERLDSHNRDNHWWYRTDDDTSKSVDKDFKVYLVGAFGSQLELSDLQKQRVFRRFMELDLPRATGRSELNAFLLCAIVANESAERFGRDKLYHPQRPPEKNDKWFQGLAQTLIDRFPRVTGSSLTKVYNKLTQGDPPTRSASEWKEFVVRESFVQQLPSHAEKSPKLASER